MTSLKYCWWGLQGYYALRACAAFGGANRQVLAVVRKKNREQKLPIFLVGTKVAETCTCQNAYSLNILVEFCANLVLFHTFLYTLGTAVYSTASNT